MATQTYPGTVGGGSIVNKTAAATFIPEIWSDESNCCIPKEP